MGLQAASGFLRGEVGRRVGLRHAPRLKFVHDDSFDRAARLNALISAANKTRSMTHGILLLDKPQGLSFKRGRAARTPRLRQGEGRAYRQS